MKEKIVFVYNAKSGIWNKYLDAAHKIISPSTYACDLCKLTYGNFSEKEIWKNFRKQMDLEFDFLYQDTFLEKYNKENYSGFQFPIIMKQKEHGFDVILDAKKIKSLGSVEELITTIKLGFEDTEKM